MDPQIIELLARIATALEEQAKHQQEFNDMTLQQYEETKKRDEKWREENRQREKEFLEQNNTQRTEQRAHEERLMQANSETVEKLVGLQIAAYLKAQEPS